eukprot:1320397-Pleurochrysis_carterae.AAC.3
MAENTFFWSEVPRRREMRQEIAPVLQQAYCAVGFPLVYECSLNALQSPVPIQTRARIVQQEVNTTRTPATDLVRTGVSHMSWHELACLA